MEQIPRSALPICTFGAAIGLPLLQGFIWLVGIGLNKDLYNQFSGRESVPLVLFNKSFEQMFIGFALGALTGWAVSSPWAQRRRWICLLGAMGCIFFALWLWNRWNFKANHCGVNGCNATSPFAFDFVQIVPPACDLFWCLGVLFIGIMMRGKPSECNAR